MSTLEKIKEKAKDRAGLAAILLAMSSSMTSCYPGMMTGGGYYPQDSEWVSEVPGERAIRRQVAQREHHFNNRLSARSSQNRQLENFYLNNGVVRTRPAPDLYRKLNKDKYRDVRVCIVEKTEYRYGRPYTVQVLGPVVAIPHDPYEQLATYSSYHSAKESANCSVGAFDRSQQMKRTYRFEQAIRDFYGR